MWSANIRPGLASTPLGLWMDEERWSWSDGLIYDGTSADEGRKGARWEILEPTSLSLGVRLCVFFAFPRHVHDRLYAPRTAQLSSNMNMNNSATAAWGAMDTTPSLEELEPFYTKGATASGGTSASGSESKDKAGTTDSPSSEKT